MVHHTTLSVEMWTREVSFANEVVLEFLVSIRRPHIYCLSVCNVAFSATQNS